MGFKANILVFHYDIFHEQCAKKAYWHSKINHQIVDFLNIQNSLLYIIISQKWNFPTVGHKYPNAEKRIKQEENPFLKYFYILFLFQKLSTGDIHLIQSWSCGGYRWKKAIL
jgi:hypothetical protein